MVAFPEELEQGSNQKPIPSHWTTTLVYRTGCALLNIEVTVSSITKCLNTSIIHKKVARCDKKSCIVLIKADIFNKAVQGMARVEEYLPTFGNSDITTIILS